LHSQPPSILVVARQLTVILLRYTAPVAFAAAVLEGVESTLARGKTSRIVFRVPLFGEMMKSCIRRGDSIGTTVAVDGLIRFTQAYIRETRSNPDARSHTYDDGGTDPAWLGEHLRAAFVRAGSDVFAQGAPDEDTDTVASGLGTCARLLIEAGYELEATSLVDGLMQQASTIHQIAPSGWINLYAKPAEELARVEQLAEDRGMQDVAARALAAWILLMSLSQTRYGLQQHPGWQIGIELLGDARPFAAAENRMRSQEWSRRWTHQMPAGLQPLLATVAAAQAAHAAR